MTDRETIRLRLEKLKHYQNMLEGYRRMPWHVFKGEETVQAAVQYMFVLAIQCCLDMGEHVIAAQGLRSPGDNRDVFRVLGEAKILSKSLSEAMMAAAGFRNLLVHDYMRIDLSKVYGHLKSDLKYFALYASAVARYVSKH